MARAHRIDFCGGVHHVMNRGGAHRTIFHSAADGATFVGLIGSAAERHDVEVLAYCLMSNHYHLLLSCPEGGLSAFMHQLGGGYARHHNDRLGRDGPIYRGRFHSLLVDSDEYLACAGRYIHRNPLDVEPPKPLDQYRWSSYRYYVTPATPPAWLSTSVLLGPNGSPSSYRAFVEDEPNGGGAEWAIDTAMLEADDEVAAFPNVKKTVLLAMLSQAGGATARRLELMVGFPSDTARRMAMHRMRRRLEAEPTLLAVVNRALQLVA